MLNSNPAQQSEEATPAPRDNASTAVVTLPCLLQSEKRASSTNNANQGAVKIQSLAPMVCVLVIVMRSVVAVNVNMAVATRQELLRWMPPAMLAMAL